MPFGFDPRKLIDEEKENKKIDTDGTVWKQAQIDQEAVEIANSLRRKSKINEALTTVDQTLREFKFEKEHGEDAYIDAKIEQNPEYRDKRLFTEEENKAYYRKEMQSMKGLLEGVKVDWDTGDEILPNEADMNENQLKAFNKGKYSTIQKEYGEKPDDEPYKNLVKFASTNAPEPKGEAIEWKTTDGNSSDPFASEVGITESVYGALISGVIKIPKGFANLGAMILDATGADGIETGDAEKSKVAQLERWWDNTYFGMVEAYGESKAKETAVGKITEMLVQIYGGWKTVGAQGLKVTQKAQKIYNKAKDAVKNGSYMRTYGNKNLYEGAKKAAELNKLSRTQEFVSWAIGGGVGGAVVYKNENIGTFGDIEMLDFIPTGLDRETRATAKDDATRMLYNKLKFSTELGFPIIPAIIGTGRVGKSILRSGKDWAYSNDATKRFLDKYLNKNLRARGPNTEEVFQAGQRMEGKMSSSEALAKDYLKNFDNIIKKMANNSQSASTASGLRQEISDLIVGVIQKGRITVKNGKAVAGSWDSKTLNTFFKSLTKDLKVPAKDALALIDELDNVHGSWAEFLNNVVSGGNINVATKEFVKLMNERIGTTLSNQYKIFGDNALRPINEYKVASDVRDEVAKIIQRQAKESGAVMAKTEAQEAVNSIIKNVILDPNTATPVFKFEAKGPLRDKAMTIKNIAENITGGGKFKPDAKGGLIQTESDLNAFKKLFGNYANSQKVIANVTTDLANFAARDRFYNKVKLDSDALIAKGERALVYPTYNAAVKGFNANVSKVKIIETPLELPMGLADDVYTPPLNGVFTTEDIAAGLKYGAKGALDKKAMPIWYQAAVLIPKGLVQAGKTVFGPFTHARNFSSGAITTVAMGNIFINPLQMAKAFRTAYKTIQPQLIQKNKPGLKVATDTSVPGQFRPGANTTDPDKLIKASDFTEEGGQSLYRFLLDEGMVNSSATYKELMGIIEDTQKTGFFEFVSKKMNNKLLKGVKKLGEIAQDLYIAEDDFWKVWNFAAESHRIRRAYKNAVDSGKIKMADVPGGSLESVDILKLATQNVRDMLPNYAYVSPFIKGLRAAPVSNFVSWPSEIIRGSTNMTVKAIAETKDPIMARVGWERLMGMTAAWATVPPLAVWGFQQAYGFTMEKLNALKEFVPWFSADSTILPIYIDGEYKYIDFSRGFFYDTITSPIQSVINQVEANKDKPTLPMVVEGMVRASARFVEPFISEAMWVGGIMDIIVRGGETRSGSRVFNERDSWGTKVSKSIAHQAKIVSPGSRVQIMRLYAAITGDTIKGQDFEIPDELLGLVGARPAPLDIMKTMNITLNQFLLKNERLERGLIFEGLRTGDPVDPNDIIKQFFYANKQKYESYSGLRRKIDAGGVLGYQTDIAELFGRREQKSDYGKIMENEFMPFTIKKSAVESFENLKNDQEKKGLPFTNPLNDMVLDKINEMVEAMVDMPLNKKFDLNVEDFLFKPRGRIDIILPEKTIEQNDGIKWKNISQTPPLGETPQPVVNNAQMAQNVNPITNLTSTQEALLSPTEKVIASRT
jgi:hypothetical protein